MPEQNPPQPENYNPKTHFLQVAAKSLNREIRDYFDPLGEFDDENISAPTSALKRACLIDPEESLLLNVGKMLFYGLMAGKVVQDIGDTFYGIPKSSFKDIYRELDAQVILFFKEDQKSARQNDRQKHPLDMRVSFRLKDRAEMLTKADVTALQNRIIQQFKPNFRHYKGLKKFSYRDPANGFSGTCVFSNFENEAKDIYQKACAIAQVPYSDDFLTASERSSFRTETENILGEPVRLTNKPRTGFVYFQRAELYLKGSKDQNLVQRYGDRLSKTQIV
ncbi:hypothetical protein [Picosynechococcus sp. PCC 8807]|uniref:hypothetical protein n=1 Tax=Picosynechococcus sp. PCC 8807 TaxID=195248 RepID=UPI0008108318|nr:hypothetical protein [Picosynechococcus sp. PCC 8807]ANV90774.1 hypothetical protein AWQ24_09095 [Picosynechococcus sp. PCC 8807]